MNICLPIALYIPLHFHGLGHIESHLPAINTNQRGKISQTPQSRGSYIWQTVKFYAPRESKIKPPRTWKNIVRIKSRDLHPTAPNNRQLDEQTCHPTRHPPHGDRNYVKGTSYVGSQSHRQIRSPKRLVSCESHPRP